MPAKKQTAKAKAVKKPAAKKAPVTKAAIKATAKPKAIKKITDKLTKSQLLTMVSDHTEVSKKDVASVLDTLETVIAASLKKGAIGEFTLPGLAKIVTVRKPAVKARKGVNPFTGEETTFKAKPARNVVKVRPLKKLKDMA